MNPINRLFDKVYVINLEKDEDRMKAFSDEAANIGLDFQRFNAVDRNQVVNEGLHEAYSQGMDYSSAEFQALAARIACRMSHYRAVGDAIKCGAESVFIFEDDVRFSKDFVNKFNEQLKMLPSDWSLLFASCGLERGERSKINDVWYRMGSSFWGWWSYGLRGEAMITFREYCDKVTHQHFDTKFRSLGFCEHPTVRVYRPISPLIIHDNGRRFKSNNTVKSFV